MEVSLFSITFYYLLEFTVIELLHTTLHLTEPLYFI